MSNLTMNNLTEWEVRDWLFDIITANEAPDVGKAWGKFRAKFQDRLPSGYGRDSFIPFYNNIKEVVACPLMKAAHLLSKLERDIILNLQELLKSIAPRDANHTRDLIEVVTAFTKERLDLETACDNAVKELENAGIYLPEELKCKIAECWPEE